MQHDRTRGREELREPLDRVAREAPRQAAVPPPPPRTPPRVGPCRHDRPRRATTRTRTVPTHDAVDPALVGDERQAREQEDREREDVETAIDHDRREAASPGVRAARDPARPQQVADPSRKHVVHRHAGDDHLDERHLRDAGVGDLPPPRRLQPVDDADAGHGHHERSQPDVLQRLPDGARGRRRGSRGTGRPRTPGCRRSPRPQESGCVGCPARRTEAGPTAESGTTVTGEGCGQTTVAASGNGRDRTLAHRPDRSRAAGPIIDARRGSVHPGPVCGDRPRRATGPALVPMSTTAAGTVPDVTPRREPADGQVAAPTLGVGRPAPRVLETSPFPVLLVSLVGIVLLTVFGPRSSSATPG